MAGDRSACTGPVLQRNPGKGGHENINILAAATDPQNMSSLIIFISSKKIYGNRKHVIERYMLLFNKLNDIFYCLINISFNHSKIFIKSLNKKYFFSSLLDIKDKKKSTTLKR